MKSEGHIKSAFKTRWPPPLAAMTWIVIIVRFVFGLYLSLIGTIAGGKERFIPVRDPSAGISLLLFLALPVFLPSLFIFSVQGEFSFFRIKSVSFLLLIHGSADCRCLPCFPLYKIVHL